MSGYTHDRCHHMAWVMTLTYDQAEWHYHYGSIDQTDWDLYRFYWRNGAPRFSSLAQEFDLKHPGKTGNPDAVAEFEDMLQQSPGSWKRYTERAP